MAKSKKKRRPAKKKRKAKSKSGLQKKSGASSRSSASAISIQTLPQVALSWAIVRLLSGATYAYFRSQLKKAGADPKKISENFSKAKVIVPALLLVMVVKKWLPFNLPGLAPILLQSALNALVENTESLRKLFDLEMLDAQPASTVQKTGGAPRTWAQTANQIAQAQRGLGTRGPAKNYALPQPRSGAMNRKINYELAMVGE